MLSMDIKRLIANYLTLNDCYYLFQVNHDWNKLSTDQQLWKMRLYRDYRINSYALISRDLYKSTKMNIRMVLRSCNEEEFRLASRSCFNYAPVGYRHPLSIKSFDITINIITNYWNDIYKQIYEADLVGGDIFIEFLKLMNRFIIMDSPYNIIFINPYEGYEIKLYTNNPVGTVVITMDTILNLIQLKINNNKLSLTTRSYWTRGNMIFVSMAIIAGLLIWVYK